MNAHSEAGLLRRIREAVVAAPQVLLAYIIFAVVVTFTDFGLHLLAPESLQARLVPYTGWIASMCYAFTIFIAFMLVFQHKVRRFVRLGISFQLLLQIAYGVHKILQMGGETFGNPYLTISPWQCVWTIVLPSFWIIVLHSPRMNRYCRQANEPNAA